jgi:23S rRNA (guanosine2251-2'-O)-methyltransferase
MSEKNFLFGLHAVQALLSNQATRVIELLVLQDRRDNKIQALIKLAEDANILIKYCTRPELDRLTHNENHQGVVAACTPAKSYNENYLAKLILDSTEPLFFLVLDTIQDPHNLGACLRTANAAGVHAVIAPKDKSVGLTATACKVASGAAENIPFVQVTNLARTLRFLKDNNVWVYGAAGEATTSLYQSKLQGSIALVLGAEGDGLRRLTREHCDDLLRIPMHGTVSSLNVSVAAGIFLFEAVRQRAALLKA